MYLDESSSFIMSVSVKHILGSLPHQKINLFPASMKDGTLLETLREEEEETPEEVPYCLDQRT